MHSEDLSVAALRTAYLLIFVRRSITRVPASNAARNPRLQEKTKRDIINCLIYQKAGGVLRPRFCYFSFMCAYVRVIKKCSKEY